MKLTELDANPLVGQVDEGRHVIAGASAATIGATSGHNLYLDGVFLDQLVAAGQAGPVRVRWSHPGGDDLGLVLGKAVNWRRDADKVRVDLELTPAAAKSPSGDLLAYVEAMANHSPDMLGLSVVFSRDLDAELLVPPRTDGAVTARLLSLHAVDVVGEPAANRGMFSRGAVPVDSDTPMEVDRMADMKQAAPPVASIAELEGIAPDAPAFVLAQFKAGATVEQARLAWRDAEIVALRAKVTEMSEELSKRAQPAKPQPAPVRGPDPLPLGGSAGQPAQPFDFLSAARAKRDQLFPAFAGDRMNRGMRVAMQALAQENPNGYAEWRRNGGR